jgi:hypothetical protein
MTDAELERRAESEYNELRGGIINYRWRDRESKISQAHLNARRKGIGVLQIEELEK